MACVTLVQIDDVHLYNLARCSTLPIAEKSVGTGTAICPKSGPAGEGAICLFYGFVTQSNIVEGRKYTTANNQTRVLKEMHLMPLQQEWERASGVGSQVTKGRIMNMNVTDGGAIPFATKHTAVDENGDPEAKRQFSLLPLLYVY